MPTCGQTRPPRVGQRQRRCGGPVRAGNPAPIATTVWVYWSARERSGCSAGSESGASGPTGGGWRPCRSAAATASESRASRSETTTSGADGARRSSVVGDSPSRSRRSRSRAAGIVSDGPSLAPARITGKRRASAPAGPGGEHVVARPVPPHLLGAREGGLARRELAHRSTPEVHQLVDTVEVGASAETPMRVPTPAPSMGAPLPLSRSRSYSSRPPLTTIRTPGRPAASSRSLVAEAGATRSPLSRRTARPSVSFRARMTSIAASTPASVS